MSAAVNPNTWWAAVRFADLKLEAVPVAQVKHLNPKHFLDFDPCKIYKITTNIWNAEGIDQQYEGIVEAFGGT